MVHADLRGGVVRNDVERAVDAARRGDERAWEALVQRYSGLIWAIARGHGLNAADAADVAQTTWIKLVEHLGRIEDPRRIGAWLATTARRECLRLVRDRARQQVCA